MDNHTVDPLDILFYITSVVFYISTAAMIAHFVLLAGDVFSKPICFFVTFAVWLISMIASSVNPCALEYMSVE